MKAKEQFDIGNYLTYAMDWFDKLEALEQHAIIAWVGAQRGSDELIAAHHAMACKHAWFVECNVCFDEQVRTIPELQSEFPISMDDLAYQPLRPQTDKCCSLCGEELKRYYNNFRA